MPNFLVLRPGDGNETAGPYKVIIEHRKGPSVIALSRKKLAANLAGMTIEEMQVGKTEYTCPNCYPSELETGQQIKEG